MVCVLSAQISLAQPTPLEPSLAGGWCESEARNRCWALDIDDGLRFSFATDAGATVESVRVPISPSDDRVAYEVLSVHLIADTVPDALTFMRWRSRIGQPGHEAHPAFEIYRGERADVERLLALPHLENTGTGFCPEDEREDELLPVFIALSDLDGDSSAEAITTYSNGSGGRGSCTRTAVRRLDESATLIDTIGTWVEMATLVSAGHQTHSVILHFEEGGDLDQSFSIWTVRDGELVKLFSNYQAYEGQRGEGFGTFHVAEDGTTVIAFAEDQYDFEYGFPDSFDGFRFFVFDGTGFVDTPADELPVETPSEATATRFAAVEQVLARRDSEAVRCHPPSPREIPYFAGLVRWTGWDVADTPLRLYLMEFQSPEAAADAQRLIASDGVPGWAHWTFAQAGTSLLVATSQNRTTQPLADELAEAFRSGVAQ